MSHRKIFILTLVVTALMLGVVGNVFAQNTLVVWADGERTPVLQAVADQVEAELGITLEIVEVGFGDIRDQTLTAGPVGEGPDVFIGAHDWLGQLVSNGAVAPIELGDVAAEYNQAALNAFTFDGVLYGVPYAQENIALIRNVDLVPEAPATWQDVRTISEDLQSTGAAQYGFVLQTGDAYHNFPVISAYGGYIFGRNDDGSFNVADLGLASEGGLQAAQWLHDMYADGLMPPNVDNDVAFALFEENQLGMFVTGPWFSQRISESGVNYSIDPLPGAEGGMEVGAPFSGVQGFMISGYSDNQLLAEIFLLDYVSTVDFMQSMFDQGGRPPVFAGVDTSSQPNIAGFVAAGSNAVPMPAIPEMSAVWSAAGNALTLLSQSATQEVDPVEAFTVATEQILEAINLLNAEERIVGLPGSLQDEVGCESDWNPACEATFMSDEDGDGIYTLTLTLPAGDYEYKVAMNGAWDENYGANGERDGANITLSLAEETEVTFTYDDSTNVVTDSVNNPE